MRHERQANWRFRGEAEAHGRGPGSLRRE